MSAGRIDKVNPANLLEFFADNANTRKEEIGNIDILEKFTFVDVLPGAVNAIVERCSGKRINKRKVNIEIAKGKK